MEKTIWNENVETEFSYHETEKKKNHYVIIINLLLSRDICDTSVLQNYMDNLKWTKYFRNVKY